MIRNENYKTIEQEEEEKNKKFELEEKQRKDKERQEQEYYEKNKGNIMKKKFIFRVKNIVFCLFMAAILSALIIRFVLFKAYVPSESMAPTLNKGDQLFVTRIYNYDKIKRGDILVFKSKELNDRLVKRVIGLPGDMVEIDNGIVYVNGDKLDESYVVNADESDKRDGIYYVPDNGYFFLGDNRPVSDDAGLWKNPYIYQNDIIGKAQLRVYPFNNFGFVDNKK